MLLRKAYHTLMIHEHEHGRNASQNSPEHGAAGDECEDLEDFDLDLTDIGFSPHESPRLKEVVRHVIGMLRRHHKAKSRDEA